LLQNISLFFFQPIKLKLICRMKLRASFFIFLSILSLQTNASGEISSSGGRAAAMGNTSVSFYDGWSGFNNQAGLGWCQKFSTGVYYENRFLVKELSTKAISAVFPVKKGGFGLSFRYFGFSQYNEIRTGLAFGMRFGNSFSVGIQLDYLRFHIGNDYGNRNLFTFEIGIQYRVREQLCLGVHLFNPVPIKLTDDPVERLPTVIRLGIAWQTSKNLATSVEVEKDLVNRPIIKAGLEYHFVNPLYIRIGFLTNPSQFTFGFGLEFGKLSFDVASSYHMLLGFSPQGSIIYLFN
jgi:hypothetical protein